jgi:hypothetical protein
MAGWKKSEQSRIDGVIYSAQDRASLKPRFLECLAASGFTEVVHLSAKSVL